MRSARAFFRNGKCENEIIKPHDKNKLNRISHLPVARDEERFVQSANFFLFLNICFNS